MKRIRKKVSIYAYSNYREYLKDKFAEKKAKREGFSFRNFALRAGVKSGMHLKLVMDGKRNLTRDTIPKFAMGIGLNERETAFFEQMVLMNQAQAEGERQKHYQKMLALNGFRKTAKIQQSQYKYFSNWYNTAIREIIGLPGVGSSSTWIAAKLSPSISTQQVRESLRLLEELGLIKKDKSGQYRQTAPILSTDPEIASVHAMRYHESMIGLAKQSLEKHPYDRRDVSGITATISKQCFEDIKQKIVDFRAELMEMIEKDRFSNLVYQINFQLFPLAEPPKEEG